MPLQYKIKILDALKAKGHTTYSLRNAKDKADRLSESTIQKLRKGEGVSWENIETICRLLECQPADILEYVEDPIAEE